MRLTKSMAWRFSRPSELIWDPLAGLAGVIEIEHRGDSVDAKAVDVVLVEPEEGVGDEIVLDFIAAIIV